MNRYALGLDIGSNSIGSVWIDRESGEIVIGTSIFPAGVDESDDKRGDPKNAKRRTTRRTRITLARRADRKHELKQRLVEVGLLPSNTDELQVLLDSTDPWELRRRGLDEQLSVHEFGRVLFHLAQRRGALGLKIADPDEEDETDADAKEDGKVKAAISAIRQNMSERDARTFGEFIAMVRGERVTILTKTKDQRPQDSRKGPREYRDAVRNKAGSYEHCADRAMIRDEFAALWNKQKGLGRELARILTDELRKELDNEQGDSIWRHRGLLFGQRRARWDEGTLGRCSLHPSDRCAPHADMDASRYRVVETVNNLKIIERGKQERPLTPCEREKIKDYLSGPLGMEQPSKKKGETEKPPQRPKTTVSVTDLRKQMGPSKEGWGRATKTAQFRFNIETDSDKTINTDWFSREIIHGAITLDMWKGMTDGMKNGINRAILKFDPDEEGQADKLRSGVLKWAGLDEAQAEALVAAWKRRPRLDSKRLNMSRRAVRNILAVMDCDDPCHDSDGGNSYRWLTEIVARKQIAEDADFLDATTGKPHDDHTRRRYATGAKGSTARDRHYLRKHKLRKDGKDVLGPDGEPISEPPPAPLISNPVVRKAIHEVRRHVVQYMMQFERKPDEVYVELAREAKMGKKDADRLLYRNRLRNRIRRDILTSFELDSSPTSQQRAALERVVLCVQQGGVCPLCGNQTVQTKITPRMAAYGEGCEVAHIIPRASGGHNGFSNIVLSHTKCNRDMARRTPRQFWSDGAGFERGMVWIEGIYGDVKRSKPSEIKNVDGPSLWSCYFRPWDDKAKIERFKMDVIDIEGMTPRQMAATTYASRQVMAYLADAIYDGKGLPERGGKRRIFATDGMWTSRLRREWGLIFDPHQFKAKGLSNEDEHQRKEKWRGDHRHHAIDAVVIACCTQQVRNAWEKREKQADKDGVNTADGQAMENYRKNHRLDPPAPYKSREEFREAVRRAVFGDDEIERPISHRPVKRKLIGAFHEETLLGPILDPAGNLTDGFTARKGVVELTPNHLRAPRDETEKEATERLATRRAHQKGIDQKAARKWARAIVRSKGFKPMIVDPPPGKSGIVRDRALRMQLRKCVEDAGLNPDTFTKIEIKQLAELTDKDKTKGLRHKSGVPIRSVVLERTMSDPVIVSRWATDHATGNRYKVYDATTGQGDAAAARAYIGGNNHHIEIRVAKNKKGQEVWSGEIVSAFQAAQRKLARLRAFREAGVPKPKVFRKLPRAERAKWTPILRAIEQAHPLVDRSDKDDKGGAFVMSLCEGETLFMKHKVTGKVGYFVVAKLVKPHSIVLVPHWDARAAGERKDSQGKKIPDSKRDDFPVTPSDLKKLAPPDHPHAIKIRVSPLGDIQYLKKD